MDDQYCVERVNEGWRAYVVSDTRLVVTEKSRELALQSIRQLHLDKINDDRHIDQLIKRK